MSTTTNLQKRYSLIFVLTVFSIFIFVMIKSLGNGVGGFEVNYYEKKILIEGISYFRYLLGDRVFSQVLVGKDRWLSYTSDGNLDDYQNSNLYKEKLKTIHNQIIILNEELQARGITLIVMVAPNKETVYPEKVPGQITKLKNRSRLTTFLNMFDEPNAPIILDLRPALEQARGDLQLYYKTDTHWNGYGAYVAYREIMHSVSQVYPDLQIYSRDDFEFTETSPTPRDLARIMGAEFITEPGIAVQPKFKSTTYFERIQPLSNISLSWSNNGNNRKLLIYHDSFGDALNTFLQYNFNEAVYVRNGAYECPSTGSWIDTFKPDIVVIEIVERDLIYLENLLSKLICK